MAWLTRVGGKWRSSDDLTLDELVPIEKVSGIGWGYINPLRNVEVARALLATWLIRDGLSDDEAKAEIAKFTTKTLKHTFRYTEDDDLPDDWEDGLPVVDPKDPEAGSTAGS